jgi:ATP-dependent Lhr-like helicase
LLAGRHRAAAVRPRTPSGRTSLRRTPRLVANRTAPALAGGRWSLLVAQSPSQFAPDELAEAVAVQLLERWGVVFRELIQRESLAIAWREVLWALRRLEARGVARGGRFVAGGVGEQFALPEALTALRAVHEAPADGTTVTICAADPVNLTGIVLPGPRVPSRRNQFITFVDGIVAENGDGRSSGRRIGAAS